jgi:NaMN:DMB phosphoribosyltransferase
MGLYGKRKRFSKLERRSLWMSAVMAVTGIAVAVTGRSLDVLIDGGTICVMAVTQVFLVRTSATWRQAFESATIPADRIREHSHLN